MVRSNNEKERAPLPLLNEEWFSQRFPDTGKIHVLEGLGEKWKRQKLNSTIVVAFHADLEVSQLKHFFPLFFVQYLIQKGYSINPVVYIGALRDIGRGYHRGDIRERIAEAHQFFQGVFSQSTKIVIVEDRLEIQRDVYSILRILEFEKSLQEILRQINTLEKLNETQTIRLKEKKYTLSSYEKELLKIYLFDRNKLGTEIKKYPYLSWGLESLGHLGTSYNIFDKSNAGLSVLKKIICTDQDIEYPATIVLPDPVAVSGKLMRYLSSRDLNPDETLFISDSYRVISRKIFEREDVSLRFLDYLFKNIIQPFSRNSKKGEIEVCWNKLNQKHLDKESIAPRELKRCVLSCYWEFIKPYFDAMESILGTHESLFVPEELVERTLDALGSKRNRKILAKLAINQQKHKEAMTVSELFEAMELKQGAKKGLWRNLETLVRCGLVDRIPEGKKLQKYNISRKKTSIRIRLSLSKKEKREPRN